MKPATIEKLAVVPNRNDGDGRQTEVPSRTARSGKRVEVAVAPQELCSIFGVDDARVASRLLSQIVNALHPGAADIDPAEIAVILGLVEGIAPANTLEAMTAALLVATQQAATDAMRRGLHPDQTPGGRSMYLALGLKAARTFAKLLETFNQGRGKGVARQEITVQHITVESGARAVVGGVNTGRGQREITATNPRSEGDSAE